MPGDAGRVGRTRGRKFVSPLGGAWITLVYIPQGFRRPRLRCVVPTVTPAYAKATHAGDPANGTLPWSSTFRDFF